MTSDFCVAVHALVYLDHRACSLSSEELAENICTNSARVRKVLAKLKAPDMIAAREGSEGGYVFAGDAGALTLARVARAMNVKFASMNWLSGDPDRECLVSSGMGGAMEEILEELNSACLMRLENITIRDIEQTLFASTLAAGEE